ncbi:MAG TPA: hypothetical protein DCP63_09345, partial [Bacteroidetes bacterium]|nr:hypothetical protein [Bacteroidota bacterium]
MNNDLFFENDLLNNYSPSQQSRREFIKKAGSGIFILFAVGDTLLFSQESVRAPQQRLPSDFNAFLRIGPDGRVTCFTGKIEMGQGVHTSLPQMLADELDVALDSVEILMGDTDLCPWDMGTFGSLSTRVFGPALRAAGAEARQVLLELASENLKVPRERLSTENGVVFDKADKKNRVSYGKLADGKKIERRANGKASVKKPAEFKIMGKSVPRRDAADKVTGKANYAGDIHLPGMLAAKILRPPAHGAKLVDIDLSEAEQIRGVQVIKEGDFVAILHKYPDVAEQALSKIKARFDRPDTGVDDKTIFDHLLKVAPQGRATTKDGNLQQGEQLSKTVVEETYFNDYVAHAPIEPHTAVVNIEGGKATVWASTQTPFSVKGEIARELGVAPEQVRVITPFVGGGFGGKTRNLQAVEAARLAKLSGKPVQVAWSRKEEFFFDTFRPAAVVKIKSGIAENGGVSLWDYHVYFAGERGSQHF